MKKLYRFEHPQIKQGVSHPPAQNYDKELQNEGGIWHTAWDTIKQLSAGYRFKSDELLRLYHRGYALYEYEVEDALQDQEVGSYLFRDDKVTSKRVLPMAIYLGMFEKFLSVGVQLDNDGFTESEFLADYQVSKYERPSVAADLVIFGLKEMPSLNPRKKSELGLQVLMVKRSEHPFINQWALPGGFVGSDESAEEAAQRVLMGEAGFTNAHLEQLATFSDIGRDPRTRVITVAYMALTNIKDLVVMPGSASKEVEWMPLRTGEGAEIFKSSASVFETGVAFDHWEIIKTALRRLQSKIEWTDIGFSVMPNTFTLTQLQSVFEEITGKKYNFKPFRNMVSVWVEETGEVEAGVARRPAQIYRRKTNFK